jgi:hypothetical protein
MDRSYKSDIPTLREALERLAEQYSPSGGETDWKNLRIAPLLEHARALEKLMLSPLRGQSGFSPASSLRRSCSGRPPFRREGSSREERWCETGSSSRAA